MSKAKEPLYSVKDISDLVGKSTSYIIRCINKHSLVSCKTGNRSRGDGKRVSTRYYKKSDVMKFARERGWL